MEEKQREEVQTAEEEGELRVTGEKSVTLGIGVRVVKRGGK
jgi:hypothetical protein